MEGAGAARPRPSGGAPPSAEVKKFIEGLDDALTKLDEETIKEHLTESVNVYGKAIDKRNALMPEMDEAVLPPSTGGCASLRSGYISPVKSRMLPFLPRPCVAGAFSLPLLSCTQRETFKRHRTTSNSHCTKDVIENAEQVRTSENNRGPCTPDCHGRPRPYRDRGDRLHTRRHQ